MNAEARTSEGLLMYNASSLCSAVTRALDQQDIE